MKIAIRHENGFTLIELLVVIFIVVLAATAFNLVVVKHGMVLAVMASGLAVLIGGLLVVLFYRWSWSRDKRRLTYLREKYRTIYQVKALPASTKGIVKPDWAEIQIGDYGWEAHPIGRDGLIYLQGLTKRWQVVWHAGFHPEQIEKVAEKPASQYDYWAPDWATPPPPPPCPFPVRERSTPTMGLPHHSGHYFKEYPSEYYKSPVRIESDRNVPLLTDKFRARSKALSRHSLIWLVLFVATMFGISRFCFYMDSTKPALWIQILTGCGILGVVVMYFFLRHMTARQVAKKYEIRCPVCGNEITAGGLAGWPRRELCNRCGTKVIEDNMPIRFRHLKSSTETLSS